jgi:hypothetical protein
VENLKPILVRLALFVGAIGSLWIGVEREQSWLFHAKAYFELDTGGLLMWLAFVALSGFLFTLAAIPPAGLRYRPLPPLLLGLVPALFIAHFVAYYSGVEPRFLITHMEPFYFDTNAQFALAVLFGVALAAGFVPRREGTAPA